MNATLESILAEFSDKLAALTERVERMESREAEIDTNLKQTSR